MELKDVLTQAKQIWHEIFGDSREFIEHYFSLFAKDKIVYLEKSERIYGFCLLPAYNFSIFRDVIKADYVSGLCVADDERRKGYGKLLVSNAMRYSFDNGHQIVFLIAQDNETMQFYQQFGFASCCINNRKVFKDINDVFLETHTLDFDYKTFLKNYDCGDIQSQKYLLHERKTLDMYHESGYTFVNVVDDENEGFSAGAILIEEEEYVNVVELNVKNHIQKTIILSLIADRYEKNVRYKEPYKEYNSEGLYMDVLNKSKRDILQMIRVIDVDTCLSIFASNHPYIDAILRIEDNWITENNKIVWIKDGKLLILDKAEDVPGQREIKDTTIKQISALCFANSYLTLLFDE
ncbi:MAG: GNAT family N-acetyltransferase [Bacteroidales bacterium]|nr:GNAT family N-acetyltransferase [Bacteroidales bacterium]